MAVLFSKSCIDTFPNVERAVQVLLSEGLTKSGEFYSFQDNSVIASVSFTEEIGLTMCTVSGTLLNIDASLEAVLLAVVGRWPNAEMIPPRDDVLGTNFTVKLDQYSLSVSIEPELPEIDQYGLSIRSLDSRPDST